jgi:molybdopterin-guanine dinucleotide biosynthesis protein A
LDGRPLLHRAIESVRDVADEVIVVLAPSAAPTLPDGVRVVHDDTAFGGPLVGLSTGLQVASGPSILVIGGDMPGLQAPVASALLDALAAGDRDAVVLTDAGRPRPLPLALRRDPAAVMIQRLVDAGERRLGALPEALHAVAIPEAVWRALDPNGQSTVDIDVPSDLP